MRFKDFAARSWDDLLPGVTKGAVDFVSRTVCYESTLRLTAREVRFAKSSYPHARVLTHFNE